MLHVYRSRGSLNIHVMKSKIKSLLAIGDRLSPDRSRNTTGAKTAAVDAFGVVSSPSQRVAGGRIRSAINDVPNAFALSILSSSGTCC